MLQYCQDVIEKYRNDTNDSIVEKSTKVINLYQYHGDRDRLMKHIVDLRNVIDSCGMHIKDTEYTEVMISGLANDGSVGLSVGDTERIESFVSTCKDNFNGLVVLTDEERMSLNDIMYECSNDMSLSLAIASSVGYASILYIK